MRFLRLAALPLLLLITGYFMSCTEDGTCTDGIQNQFECGIDCGGPCLPCAGTPPPGSPCSSIPTGIGIGSDSDLDGLFTDTDLGTDFGIDTDGGDGTDSDSGSDSDAGTDTDTATDTDTDTGGGTGNSVEASIDNEAIVFEQFTGTASNQIVCTGGGYSFTFNFNDITDTGTFTLGPTMDEEVLLLITQPPASACVGGMGSITIDENNAETISGTFSFECTAGLLVNITNGTFSFSL